MRLVLLLAVIGLAAGSSRCGGVGWVYMHSPLREVCYKYVTDRYASWDDAQQVCKIEGGSLASMQNMQELVFMNGLKSSHSDIAELFLGGKRVAGRWYWVDSDGTHRAIDSALTNWDNGQPDNQWGTQNCLQMWWWKPKWDDVWCDAKRLFICEKELHRF